MKCTLKFRQIIPKVLPRASQSPFHLLYLTIIEYLYVVIRSGMNTFYYSGTDSVTRFPFSILTNRNRLSLKINVISMGSSSTSSNS